MKTGRLKSLILSASLAAIALPTSANAQIREPLARDTIEATLERFVANYRIDPSAVDTKFGIEVDSHRWRVISRKNGDRRTVTLERDFGDDTFFYFKTDRETLNLIDQGIWSALTGMGSENAAGETPMDILFTEGYEKPADYEATSRRLLFHFWTKGFPEIVPYRTQNSRVVHGAPASVLYYDKNFRSAAYHVPAGLGREQAPITAAPFPRMVIVISGTAEGESEGNKFTAEAGEMFFMAPDVSNHFWNASDEEVLSFIWVMWGDGA